MSADTIFAISSGRPPAAIAVVRCSGPHAHAAAAALAGSLPPRRLAQVRTLRDGEGNVLDSALVLRFDAPASATGEDLVEFHCHGGRAVVAAVEAALARQPGLRLAEPGEFTRRALGNGRIDLLEAQGLADLLEAETEAQRVAAMAAVEGRVGSLVRGWMDRVAFLSARIEAALDYAEEDDVATDAATIDAVGAEMTALSQEIGQVLAAPPVERLRDGIRVVIAGPPNAGKSTLLNLLSERDAAIVSPISGTTRDRIEAPVVRQGLPFLLVDTAGLVETSDPIEAIGVARAGDAVAVADLLLWLGDDPPPRPDAIWVHARSDLAGRGDKPRDRSLSISATDPMSIEHLWDDMAYRAAALMGGSAGQISLRQQQRALCCDAADALLQPSRDPILLAESLAHARRLLARLLGIDATEAMLDALFGRFCLGK